MKEGGSCPRLHPPKSATGLQRRAPRRALLIDVIRGKKDLGSKRLAKILRDSYKNQVFFFFKNSRKFLEKT